MKKIWVFIFVFLLAVILCQKAYSDGPIEVRLNTGHPPWGLWSTYIGGMAQGFFAEEGLKLKLVSGSGSNEALQMVALGKDHFADTGSASVIVAKSQGMPLRIIATMSNDGYSGAIIYWKRSGIKTMKDLEGKKIASNAKTVGRAVIESFLRKESIRSSLVSTPVDGEFLLFMGGKVDAYVGIFSLEKSKLDKANAKDWGYFMFRDNGVKFPGITISTNEKFLKEKPEIVRKFLRAAMRSYQYAAKNPEYVARLLVDAYPHLDYEIESSRVKAIYKYTVFSPVKIGFSDEQVWRESIKMLYDAKIIGSKINTKDIISNEFLPEKERLN